MLWDSAAPELSLWVHERKQNVEELSDSHDRRHLRKHELQVHGLPLIIWKPAIDQMEFDL